MQRLRVGSGQQKNDRMRLHYVLLPVLMLAFAACSRKDDGMPSSNADTTCSCDIQITPPYKSPILYSDSLVKAYITLWKQLLQDKNAMPDAYFTAHIKDTAVSMDTTQNGDVYFAVGYLLTIDWAKIPCQDYFPVKLSSRDDAYQYLNIPRDIFLDEQWIKFCIDREIYADLSSIQLVDKLSFANCESATASLKDQTGYRQLCPSYFSLDSLGYPLFSGSGIVNYGDNKCVFGSINLDNKKAMAGMSACYVF
ncbi:MAG: hypothetical protein QM802_06360 [Agriterribacter sp.]